ncbi:hypothetical protein BST81_17900 [Leptolyngbya sp. 'hensonii']|uniref:hypothetical protein n=1 Tax=Leptolyngbya sp. 'hensonii' TaxID=1922337 RepID=UPI00094FDA31|nr:hypothetical protein [Leptolyngbya sp. 'hensonii']OLP17219.1 hypothetical protein BST81_17900 [Leptolyngbya sp. 'hensonii']
MLNRLGIALLTTGLLLSQSGSVEPLLAGTCASSCGPKPIQFVPGQPVALEVVNRTSSIVLIQRVQGSDPIPLQPGQILQFDRWGGTQPNISVVFWDQTSLPLLARIAQPTPRKLRVEILPGGRPPGDRSVYLRDDGRVSVF